MNILFAHSFFMNFDDKQKVVREPYPPLATLIAASVAREAGHRVSLFDAMLATSTDDFASRFAAGGFDAVVFFEDNFNWLSKMCLARMRAACITMIAMARAGEALVLVAGSDASDFPDVFLRAGADYVIAGEAEFRMLAILDHHRDAQGTPFRGPGVFQLESGRVSGSPPQRGLRDLSRFPGPAWDLVEMEPYRRIWRDNHGYFSLNMMTTRGCPYRCNWCAKPIHGRRYDVRDPADVARELHRLKQDARPDHIWFTDDIFGLKPHWVAQFADQVVALDCVTPFKIQARADLMKPALVADLARAGCKTVWMGVESGSQRVLDAMDKDLKVADIYRATELLKQAGIEVCFFLQFAYPGETARDIRATWDMIADLKPDQIGISVAYPLPGTPFHHKVADQLTDRDHWDHSQFMKPMHQTPYPAEFYAHLYHYFHALFARLKRPFRSGLHGLLDRWRHWRIVQRIAKYGVEGLPFKTPGLS